LYARLGSAYGHFYRVLGFLSPEIEKLVQHLQNGYAASYMASLLPEYTSPYARSESSIARAYEDDDYSEAYAVSMDRSMGCFE
jgi:hypothetical protein